MTRLLLLAATLLLAGCGSITGSPSPSASPLVDNVVISVLAAPVCPVETTPPDPACAPRRLEGVEIILTGPATIRLVSDENGVAIGTVAPGTYTVTPQPTDQAMGTAGAFELVVPTTGSIGATATYDTGIR